MKYEELFQLKDFQKGKLLTGNNILLREITGAHVIEMADGVNWAGRGELVFTSGVGFHDIDNEMKLLIETVDEKLCSRNRGGDWTIYQRCNTRMDRSCTETKYSTDDTSI